jgi:hypothetical protein
MTRFIRLTSLAMVLTIWGGAPIRAWNGHGHMLVAYLAYQQLSVAQQGKAGELLKAIKPATILHEFQNKVATLPVADQPAALFALAATWPDRIRSANGYSDDGVPGSRGERPQGPTSSQNTGYADKLHHKYWHFVDQPFTRDGSPLPSAVVPNASERIGIFRTTLASSASLNLRSYDLVWLLHLVGDIHQPLHATTRVSKSQPNGDAGGNLVHLCTSPCRDELHGFWDGASGASDDVAMVIQQGKSMHAATGAPAADLDPKTWANESFALAKGDVYTTPVGEGAGPFTLTPGYTQKAQKIADERISLAAARLANILKADLK